MGITAWSPSASAVSRSTGCRESFCHEPLPRSAMRADIYWIPGPWPGRLGIAPRPRGGDWLADEVKAWRAAGVDVVTSLLTPEEVAELGLQEEEALVRRQ